MADAIELHSPWHFERAARELIAAVVDRHYPQTAFRERFGDELLMDVYGGEPVQALAWMLALERAADALLKTSDDPVEEAWKVLSTHCEHWRRVDATWDLARRRVYCDDCADEVCREQDEVIREARENRPGPDDYDRCNVCGDLGEVGEFRVLLAAHWVEGRACEACRAYAGIQ
jgi:hypothetical protein